MTDTDILIDAAYGLAEAVQFLRAQRRAAGIRISTISAMELTVGCRTRRELQNTQRFLLGVEIVPVNAEASRRALQLMQTYFLSHGLLIPDALIAATAVEHNLPLYTKNSRHFQMIASLKVVRPY